MTAQDTLFTDAYHSSIDDALRDAHRRKQGVEPAIVTVEPSPYGGWRVRCLPADFAVDMMAEAMSFGSYPGPAGRREYR
jgi:hypothetical protein